jgi:hypothetical protein
MSPGVTVVAGMSLQIPAGALVLTEGENDDVRMEVRSILVRLDLWTMWLEIGCIHAAQAAEFTGKLRPEGLDDATRAALLADELREAMVAVTALAFALDGFYDVVQKEFGRHPDAESLWPKNRTARHIQVAETLRYHFKTSPDFSKAMRTTLRQLFEFRDRAVHPSSKFVAPIYRPEIDSDVHPHFVTFSGPHAVHCRAMVLTLTDQLLNARAINMFKPGAHTGWIDRGREELARLSKYRTPGDDAVAFAEHMALPEEEI